MCVFFIHFPCFLMCIMFYFSFIRLHVCAFAIHSMVHCGSAFEPGTSGLPYYCTPPVCVPDVLGALAVWWQKKTRSSVLVHITLFRWQHLFHQYLYKIYWCVYILPWPTRNIFILMRTCIDTHIHKTMTLQIRNECKINKKFNDKIHEKHKFINRIRITRIHNVIYKKTHEHKLTNKIIITWIH